MEPLGAGREVDYVACRWSARDWCALVFLQISAQLALEFRPQVRFVGGRLRAGGAMGHATPAFALSAAAGTTHDAESTKDQAQPQRDERKTRAHGGTYRCIQQLAVRSDQEHQQAKTRPQRAPCQSCSNHGGHGASGPCTSISA